MNVTLSLVLVGSDEAPRWAASMASGLSGKRTCCDEGHYTPEGAASHGGELAAAQLAQYARSLTPPARGALALAVA